MKIIYILIYAWINKYCIFIKNIRECQNIMEKYIVQYLLKKHSFSTLKNNKYRYCTSCAYYVILLYKPNLIHFL